jgi:hypothetical protein
VVASFFAKGTPRRAFEVQMRTARSLLRVDIPDRYCGRAWSRLQVLRRRLQIRLPFVRPVFTLATMALDPPRESADRGDPASADRKGMLRRLRRRLDRYLWRSQPGKLC